MSTRTRTLLLIVLASTASCTMQTGDPVTDEPAIGMTEDEIKSGVDVSLSDSYWRYVTGVFTPIGSCTGTIIGPHHILTAAHCGTSVMNTQVVFYRGGTPDWTTITNVDNVYMKIGVSSSDTTDLSGNFADFAILQIDKDIGMISPDYRPARLPRWYAGANVGGVQVGRGNHDGAGNPSQILRFRTNSFWSANYNDGSFETVSDGTDPGDSGGPIFTSDPGGWLVVHGGLWGYLLDWFAFRNRYTSTAYHLSSILTAMGNVNVYNWNYYGNDIGMFSSVDTLACATACTQNASCKAWTLDPQPAGSTVGNCWLKSGTGTGGFAQYGLTSGYKTQNMITRTNWDYPGNDLAFYSGYGEFACQNLCWNRSDCQAWTYTPVTPGAGWGSCWLKSSVGAGGNPLSGFNSGHKTSTLPCSLSGGVCTI